MRRTSLLMIEITIWTLGAYFFLCNLASPPRKYMIQVWDENPSPPTLLREAEEEPLFKESQYLRWQLGPPRWHDDFEYGFASFGIERLNLTRVDIPRTILWLASILATTTLLALIPHLLRRRLPPRTGFPIQPSPTPNTPIP